MDKNLKGILISFGVFVFGCFIMTVSEIGSFFILLAFVAAIVFLIKYIVDFCKQENNGYLNIVKHIIFTIVTCGVYAIYWYYRTTAFLAKSLPNEYHKTPTSEMLLSAFVPYYHVYWAYTSALAIENLYAKKGIVKEIKAPAIFLALFLYWWGGSIYIQAILNDCVTAEVVGAPIDNINAVSVKTVATPNTNRNEVEATTALKNYKELLDQGIITQEEFDSKKKEILGL